MDAVLEDDVHAPNATGVVLETIEVEPFEPVEVW